MHYLRKTSLLIGALILLASCGPGAPTAQQPASPTGAAVIATTAPTTTEASPTATLVPAITVTPAETVEPAATAAATATEEVATPAEPTAMATQVATAEPPTATQAPAAATGTAGDGTATVPPSAFGLRTDSVWIATGQRVIGLSEGQPEMPINTLTSVRVAPDGSRVIYNEGDPGTPSARLVTKSTQTGEVEELARIEGGAINPTFSPDSRQVAYSQVNGMSGWQLTVVDLQTGEERVLQEATFAQNQPMSVLVPQQWTESGLVVSRAAWFTELNSSGLYRIDPASGAQSPIYEQPALTTILSPDEKSVAMVAGSLPTGAPGNLTLTVIDVASGQQRIAVEQLTGLWTPEWSPDSTRLVYVDSHFETGASALRVLNRDGSPAGDLRFGQGGLPGMLRDVAWREAQTLMLVVVEGERVRVYEVAAGDLAQSAPREVASFAVEMGSSTAHEIVYVPR